MSTAGGDLVLKGFAFGAGFWAAKFLLDSFVSLFARRRKNAESHD